MLIAERRRRLLAHVRGRGYVSFRDLAVALGISESTVRRDLRAMVAEGLLAPTRGGVGPRHEPPPTRTPPAPARREPTTDPVAAAREAIARTGGDAGHGGERGPAGAGPHHHRAGPAPRRAQPPHGGHQLDLGDPRARRRAADRRGADRRSPAPVDRRGRRPHRRAALQGLRGAQVFLSGDGVTAERGLTTPNVFAAATDQALMAAGRQVVVLADHAKLGHDTMCQTVPSERIDVLVTDRAADDESPVDRLRLVAGIDVWRVASDSTAVVDLLTELRINATTIWPSCCQIFSTSGTCVRPCRAGPSAASMKEGPPMPPFQTIVPWRRDRRHRGRARPDRRGLHQDRRRRGHARRRRAPPPSRSRPPPVPADARRRSTTAASRSST